MNKRILIMGVGSFAHSMMAILNDTGAETACFLTRDYGHYGPQLRGKTWFSKDQTSPIDAIEDFKPDLILPMSIDWHSQSWTKDLIEMGIPILCPTGDSMQIESERYFSEKLCQKFGIPVPRSYYASSKEDALSILHSDPRAYVIKNPLCSPFSPIQAIVCESLEDTIAWLDRIDYAEGVYLQEYLGPAEAGHFVFIAEGKAYSLATNQEYNRAFTGNLGPVAGAPLGGLVEKDPEDKYGLAQQLIIPILPWFQETGYRGPLQVTAVFRDGIWYPIEYNVRLGVTSGAMFLRMMENPVEALLDVAQNREPKIEWKDDVNFGCSLTLAGYGYPYYIPSTPKLPIILSSEFDCDVWWNEVESSEGKLYIASHEVLDKGHRMADIVACARSLEEAIQKAYDNIRKINCMSSYYRTDIGQSLWPPGQGY